MKKKLQKYSIILFIILALFSIVSFIVVKSVYDQNFKRVNRPDYTVTGGLIDYEKVSNDYPRSNVSFYSGKNLLAGYLYGAENNKGLIVVAHGLGGGADSYLPQIMYFVDHGYRIFAYDCTGSYDSEGKSIKGFPQAVLDLDAALSFLKNDESLNHLPLFLFGHSWGGYAVANILNYDYDIKAVVSVAGVNSAKEFIGNQMVDMLGWFGYIEKPYLSLYQRILFGDVYQLSAVSGINKSKIPVLIIHGEDDETTLYERDSIIRLKDKITNNKVQYLTTTGIHGGHNDLFKSQEALNYIDSINETYLELYNSYNKNIPYEIKQEFYASLDNQLISEVNEELMKSIVEFFDLTLSN